MANVYQYELLHAPGAIRLLQLHSSATLSDIVECSMVHTTLSHFDNDLIDHYTALSYVWGDPHKVNTALVDGKELKITANLDTALRYMRDEQRPRLIWADAICINQQDDIEKAKQVSQMGDVYEKAQHTIIFLGVSTDSSLYLFNALIKTNHCTDRVEESIRRGHAREVLDMPWFKRVWIFQELVLSRDPWVQCGKERVRWNILFRSIAFRARISQDRGTELATTQAHVRRLREMGTARDNVRLRNPNTPLNREGLVNDWLTILHQRRGYQVLDHRDYIFAHLGLIGGSEETTALVSSASKNLTVDYTKSVKQVFEDVAAFALENISARQLMTFAEREVDSDESIHDVASWYPDWRLPAPPQIISKVWASRPEEGRFLVSSLYLSERVVHPSVLAICGRKLGCLETVTNQLPSLPLPGLPFNISSSLWDRAAVETFIAYLEGTPCLKDWSQKDRFAELLRMEAEIENEFRPRTALSHLFAQIAMGGKSGADLGTSPITGRRFGILNFDQVHRGIAVVPANARNGDVIVQVAGNSAVPCVLRPCDFKELGIKSKYTEARIRENASNKSNYRIEHFRFIGGCIIGDWHLVLESTRPKFEDYDETDVIVLALH